MITFSSATKRYPNGHEAVKSVSFTINKGEMVAITGHSGAGKSTLLKLAAGIEFASAGNVLVNDQNLAQLKEAGISVLRQNLGLVFQDHKLLFDRSVFDNVALPLEIAGFTRTEAGKRIRAALDKVGLLTREKANPVALSGGEQQRLCIARAIVNRPSILIADEPTGNLDQEYSATIMDLFRSFNQVGVTVLLSTHDEISLTRLQCKRVTLAQGTLSQ
ncbi:MAG: cell division ATP-binding protein FtsE [Betaproteobacteria bacterium]|nr:cell division protein FtsE [Betaproteobacteria bacterium UKL13-2]HCG52405.1 cell division ATP-binding protein FtsE [Betaproteobacteria bacterium]